MNSKQKKLIENLIEQIQKRFPEVGLIDVTHSPEDPNDLLLFVTKPDKEVREFELREFASELSTDILIDHGYLFLIMPTSNHKTEAA